MKYRADITIEKQPGLNEYLSDLISKRDRSEITVQNGIHIEACDATALRASFDHVCQVLKIWEDTQNE